MAHTTILPTIAGNSLKSISKNVGKAGNGNLKTLIKIKAMALRSATLISTCVLNDFFCSQSILLNIKKQPIHS